MMNHYRKTDIPNNEAHSLMTKIRDLTKGMEIQPAVFCTDVIKSWNQEKLRYDRKNVFFMGYFKENEKLIAEKLDLLGLELMSSL